LLAGNERSKFLKDPRNSLEFGTMKASSFRAVAPSLALGLLLVTQAVGRPQSHLADSRKPEPKTAVTGVSARTPDSAGVHALQGKGASVSPAAITANQNIVNQILHNEHLAIGRNERLLGQESQINQRLFNLYNTTPTSPAMARIIQAQIQHQLALFDQVQTHLNLNKIHIGNNSVYENQITRSMGILVRAVPGHPNMIEYIASTMRLQMILNTRLQEIVALPAATPFMPSP
jgi:hypothetical protein